MKDRPSKQMPSLNQLLSRRNLLIGGGLVAGGLITANWERLSKAEGYRPLLDAGERFNMFAQRLALWNRPLAPEYAPHLISAKHPSTGGFGASYIDPDPTYLRAAAAGFPDWRLRIGGLVDRPMSFTLDQLRQLPSRTQITMHSCDVGWSAIGQWTGVPLSRLLSLVAVRPEARFVVFVCMDKFQGQNVYGSLDLLDAFHPQTILAYDLNGQALPPGNGAPLRLRIELQIGYKNCKHIERILLVDRLDNIGKGRGGTWEDVGLQWYAGL